jgi:hypothetical protein
MPHMLCTHMAGTHLPDNWLLVRPPTAYQSVAPRRNEALSLGVKQMHTMGF